MRHECIEAKSPSVMDVGVGTAIRGSIAGDKVGCIKFALCGSRDLPAKPR